MVSLANRLADVGELGEELRVWQRQDRRLWRWEANEREQLILRRRDAYRAIAATLTRAWPHVILEHRFVGRVVRRPAGERARQPSS